MNRRRLLRLVGAAAATSAGCLGGGSSQSTTTESRRTSHTTERDTQTSTAQATPTETDRSAPTATERDTQTPAQTDAATEPTAPTDSPTEEWTPTPDLCFGEGTRYPAFGEPVEIDTFELTARRATLTQTYGLDHTEETYRLSDRQYVITEFEVTNLSHRRDEWTEVRTFEYVTADCGQYDVLGSIPWPGRDQPVYELERVGHFKQGLTSGYALVPGETGRVWYVGLLPAEFSATEIELAFYGEDGAFPLRWRLDEGR
ncbi:hypothetical protein [Halobaculum sp. MBLA0143]|uniref:hypothetical protein n=1 Tax=Halobaculum sp. MBLA0143 TaxID=3079933 RepID=UPI003526851D